MRLPLLNVTVPLVLGARLSVALGRDQQVIRSLTRFSCLDGAVPRLRGYVPGPQDVFVATFVKSGTNWAMQIVVQIAWRGAAEFEHIHELVPWPDVPASLIASLSDDGTWRAAPTRLRAVKTHVPLSYLPWLAAGDGSGGPERYVCVIRDPKEVLVSAHHFLLGTLGVRHRITPARWLDINLAPDLLLGAWAVHAASCWAMRERENVYVCIYDQLAADLPGHVDAIARFMDVELDAGQRAVVLQRCSLTHMQANEAAFAPLPMAFARPEQWPRMIRRGQAGDSGEMYDGEQRGRIDAFARAELERLGSDLPYDELFGGR